MFVKIVKEFNIKKIIIFGVLKYIYIIYLIVNK